MSVTKRLAIVAGALLLLGAVAATFLPTSPQGQTCGTWVAPEWEEEATDQLVERWQDLGERDFLGGGAEAAGRVASIRGAQRACDSALGTRRTVALVLLAGAVLVPAGVMFVAGGRREELRGERVVE
jgi:hypothetical protein